MIKMLTEKKPTEKEMEILSLVKEKVMGQHFDAVEFTLRGDDGSEEYSQVVEYVKANAKEKSKNLYILETRNGRERMIMKMNGFIKIIDFLYEHEGVLKKEKELIYYIRKSTYHLMEEWVEKAKKQREAKLKKEEEKVEEAPKRSRRGEFLQKKKRKSFKELIKGFLKDSFSER